MRRPVLVAIFLAFLAFAAPGSALGATPTCFGKKATHVMRAGDPEYLGTPGDDVVVGSPGPDVTELRGSGGTDYACGAGGNDGIFLAGPGSKAGECPPVPTGGDRHPAGVPDLWAMTAAGPPW
jgi:hypothetical protein